MKTYNKKQFLLPESIKSAAMYHAKVFEDGTYIFRIHDCITGIRLRGDLKDKEDLKDVETKLLNLENGLREMREWIANNYNSSKHNEW